MRKLSLKLEDLSVESFATALTGAARGTAHAHQDADTLYVVNPAADTAIDGGDTEAGVCLTCEMSCDGRGCDA